MRLQRLFEPGRIGPVTTRNRMIKTANGTSFMEDDQTVGDRMVAYYERLARGGVGFLVVESCGVEYPLGIQHVHYRPDGSYQGVQLHFDDDRFIEGFSRLTEAVRPARLPGVDTAAALRPVESHRAPAARSRCTRREVCVRARGGRASGPGLPAVPRHDQGGDRGTDRPLGVRGRAGVQGGFRRRRDQPRHVPPGQHVPLAGVEPEGGRVRTTEPREPYALPPRHRRRDQAALRARVRRARAHQHRRVQPPACDHHRRGRGDGRPHRRGGGRDQLPR